MTVLTNSFEGGTNGTTITAGNSGGLSGSAFDAASAGTGATLAFDNTHAAHGSLSCKIATGGTSSSSLFNWSTSMGSQAQIWFREYLYFTSNPVSDTVVWNCRQGATPVATLYIPAGTGKLRFQDTSFATIFTTTATISLNQWIRIEGFVTGNASTGQVELKLFNSPDSTTPTETDTSAANQNTLGAPNTYRFGLGTALANSGPWWVDDVGLSSTGYLGPVASVRSRCRSFVPSLITAL